MPTRGVALQSLWDGPQFLTACSICGPLIPSPSAKLRRWPRLYIAAAKTNSQRTFLVSGLLLDGRFRTAPAYEFRGKLNKLLSYLVESGQIDANFFWRRAGV